MPVTDTKGTCIFGTDIVALYNVPVGSGDSNTAITITRDEIARPGGCPPDNVVVGADY